MVRTGKSAWFAITSPRLRRNRIAATGKPGRSLCQDFALLLNLMQLPAQPHQLPALDADQAFLAAINGGLTDPVGNGLRGDIEFA
jgi:hypothetical protein